jgi:lysophospholipase L1-like esterase
MAPYRIIALGDSLTYGYPFGQPLSWVTLTSDQLSIPILNRGINGDSLARMLWRLTQDVIDVHPEICLLMGGTNDILQEVPIDQMKSNFSGIIERLLNGKILPVIGLPPPIQNAPMEKILAKFRNWTRTQAKAHSLQVMDFQKPFLDKRKHIVTGSLEDGVHPSSQGYQLMSQVAVKVLAELTGD